MANKRKQTEVDIPLHIIYLLIYLFILILKGN